jgi:hypothetical protein
MNLFYIIYISYEFNHKLVFMLMIVIINIYIIGVNTYIIIKIDLYI